jgi:predicted flavoprotein YhiN
MVSLTRHTVRAEAMVTRSGIEGGGIYALAAELRDAIERSGEATQVASSE